MLCMWNGFFLSARLSRITMSLRFRVRLYRVHVSIIRSLLIEATGLACSWNGMKIARCTRFPTRPVEMVSFVGITYSVASRHFTSTIFADQILIVGWRLSKEAWPPVGSLSATRCTNALVFFLLFLLYLSRFSLLSPSPPLPFSPILVQQKSRTVRCPFNAYANRIELPEGNWIPKRAQALVVSP